MIVYTVSCELSRYVTVTWFTHIGKASCPIIKPGCLPRDVDSAHISRHSTCAVINIAVPDILISGAPYSQSVHSYNLSEAWSKFEPIKKSFHN